MSPGVQEPVAAPVAPVTPVYETAAPTSNSSAFIVIICIILLILIGGTVAASLYVHNQRKPKEAAAESGSAAQQAAPDDTYIRALNLGNYPAATPVAIVTLNGETVVAGFVTRDRPDQVMQFYKVRFPIAEVTVDNLGSHLSAALPNDQRIRIDAEPQGSSTQVKIIRVQ
jgi:Flp pilus assembly protein TadG